MLFPPSRQAFCTGQDAIKAAPSRLGEKSAAACDNCGRMSAGLPAKGGPMEEAVLTKPRPAAADSHALTARSSYQWWVTWTIMLGAFLFALDTTIVTIAIPKIMTSISADLNQIQWVLIIYMIGMAVVMPAGGLPRGFPRAKRGFNPR